MGEKAERQRHRAYPPRVDSPVLASMMLPLACGSGLSVRTRLCPPGLSDRRPGPDRREGRWVLS